MATIGKPISRVDGPLKVTGKATYAYEQWDDVAQPLYGFIAGATIGKGRVANIDTTRAEHAPGVRFVMTHRNAPKQGAPDPAIPWMYLRAYPVMGSANIDHYGDAVALVVATTFEAARAAAAMLDVAYDVEPGHFDLSTNLGEAYAPTIVNGGFETDTAIGDFDAGFGRAEVKLDQLYMTPYEFSLPMETQSALALWHGDELTVYLSIQVLDWARTAIASTLGIDTRQVHIVSPYIGGGFGSKLGIHAEAILAAIAARQMNEPVKVTMTRQQIFQLVGFRSVERQRVRMGAGRDGRLAAIAHEVTMHTSPIWEYAEQSAATTRSLYAGPNRLTSHRLVPLDLQRGEDVRSPGEAPGLLAVESAMDELATTLEMDPIELRALNEPTVDPERGVPFSGRRLVECMREGARRFGWERRPKKPATMRDGRWLVGYGMAAAIRKHFQGPTKARVRLGPDGIAVVQSDMTDIGTGTYTILTQVAADALGLPLECVRVELGRSEFPVSSGSGGSWGAGNSSVATDRACRALREKLLSSVRNDTRSPLHGLNSKDAEFSESRVRIGKMSESLSEIVARNHANGVEAEGEIVGMEDDPNYDAYSIHTYGAHFAEVGVDADTAEIRLRRMLGIFSPGRVLNAKTARSQLIGGMIWGVGAALLEEAVVDTRTGAFINRDFAQYLVPVHADIKELDAVLLDGFDDKANVLGVKGLGELGICGAGAAVANAVFNATGVRVRDFPITLDKVLPELPSMDT